MPGGGLSWRISSNATAAADHVALREFRCTPPQAPQPSGGWAFPRPWERVIERGFQQEVRPPGPVGSFILIGEDEDGLAAVGYAGEDSGPTEWKVFGIAVALRRRGEGIGAELLGRVLDQIAGLAYDRGHATVSVIANIAPENAASKRVSEQHNLEFVRHDPRFGSEFEEWQVVIETGL